MYGPVKKCLNHVVLKFIPYVSNSFLIVLFHICIKVLQKKTLLTMGVSSEEMFVILLIFRGFKIDCILKSKNLFSVVFCVK